MTKFTIPDIGCNPLNYVLDNNLVDPGDWMEFGVFNGSTINTISKYTSGAVYGFDTFEGLPENWKVSDGLDVKKGHYSFSDFAKEKGIKTTLPQVDKNVKLIKGLFSDSLPKIIKNQKITFMHIDCDIYSSTKDVFKYTESNISNDCIVVFDEFINYPNYKQHEYKAFYEWVFGSNIYFEFIGMNGEFVENPDKILDKEHQKVAVRIKKNPKYKFR